MHFAVICLDSLRPMLTGREREVSGKYGKRINQEVKAFIEVLRELHFGPVCLAEKAWTLLQSLLINLCPRAHHACRIELHTQSPRLLHLYILQPLIALSDFFPLLQLLTEKVVQLVIHCAPGLLGIQTAAGHKLNRAQTVFIEIIGVLLFDAQSGVAIATPTPTKIEFVVDSADTIMATKGQAHGIVFTIASIGEAELA